MAKAFKFGRMAANMKATGETTWPTEEVDLFIQMAMYTKEKIFNTTKAYMEELYKQIYEKKNENQMLS